MGKTVRQLLAEIGSDELNEWRAHYKIEPWGDLIADQRHGIATAALANVHRDSKRKPDAYRPENFIPWHDSNRDQANKDGVLLADPEAQSNLIKLRIFGYGK